MKFYVIYLMCALGAFIGVQKISPEVPLTQKIAVSVGFPVAITATIYIVFVKEAKYGK